MLLGPSAGNVRKVGYVGITFKVAKLSSIFL